MLMRCHQLIIKNTLVRRMLVNKIKRRLGLRNNKRLVHLPNRPDGRQSAVGIRKGNRLARSLHRSRLWQRLGLLRRKLSSRLVYCKHRLLIAIAEAARQHLLLRHFLMLFYRRQRCLRTFLTLLQRSQRRLQAFLDGRRTCLLCFLQHSLIMTEERRAVALQTLACLSAGSRLLVAHRRLTMHSQRRFR